MSSFFFYPQSNKKVTADISTWSLGLGEILLVGLVKIIIYYYLPQEILSNFSDVCYNNNYSIQGLIHLTMKQTCAWFNKI